MLWTTLPRVFWTESVQCWSILLVQDLLGLQLSILCRILQTQVLFSGKHEELHQLQEELDDVINHVSMLWLRWVKSALGIMQEGQLGILQTRRKAIILAAVPGQVLQRYPKPECVWTWISFYVFWQYNFYNYILNFSIWNFPCGLYIKETH